MARRCAQSDFALGPAEQRDNNRRIRDHGVHADVFWWDRYVRTIAPSRRHVGGAYPVSDCRNNRAMVDLFV